MLPLVRLERWQKGVNEVAPPEDARLVDEAGDAAVGGELAQGTMHLFLGVTQRLK